MGFPWVKTSLLDRSLTHCVKQVISWVLELSLAAWLDVCHSWQCCRINFRRGQFTQKMLFQCHLPCLGSPSCSLRDSLSECHYWWVALLLLALGNYIYPSQASCCAPASPPNQRWGSAGSTLDRWSLSGEAITTDKTAWIQLTINNQDNLILWHVSVNVFCQPACSERAVPFVTDLCAKRRKLVPHMFSLAFAFHLVFPSDLPVLTLKCILINIY